MNQSPPLHLSLRRSWLLGELLFLAALLVYLPSLGGGFSWDDGLLVTNNPHLRSLGGLWNIWRGANIPDYFPLTYSSFWIEHHLWGDFAPGYRAVNIILHGLSAVVLWRILERLKIQWAWLGALLYAIHPVCVNSVAWISERKNLLAQLPAFLCVLLYLRAEAEKNARDYVLALGCFLAALLAKTSVVTIPPALLLLLWWRQGRWDWGWVKRLTPFFALALLLGLVTMWFQKHQAMGGNDGSAFSLAQRLVNSGHAVWFYWLKLLLPVRLALVYPKWQASATDVAAWLPGLLFVGAVAASWSNRNRHWLFRTTFLLLTLHAGLLFPILGLFPMAFQSISWVSDHLQYLAVPVFCAPLAACLEPLTHRPRMEPTSMVPKPLPALLVALPLLVLSVHQSFLHGDQERLWAETYRLNPACSEARINLGAAILKRLKTAQSRDSLTGDPLGASAATVMELDAPQMADLSRVLELSHRLIRGNDPLSGLARLNQAQALALQGRASETIPLLQEAIRIDPQSEKAHCNLGFAYESSNDLERAAEHYSRAIQLRPDYAEAHYNLGNLRRRQGDFAAAETCYRTALRLNPDNLRALINCAVLFAEQKRFDEAIRLYEAALQLEPTRPELHLNLGTAWLRAGDAAEAERCFFTATELTPSNPDAWRNLATALAVQKRFAAALDAVGKAERLAPRDPTLNRLEILLLGDAGQPLQAIEKARLVGETHAEEAEHLLTAAEALPAAIGTPPEGTRMMKELARQVIALHARGLATPQQLQRANALITPPAPPPAPPL